MKINSISPAFKGTIAVLSREVKPNEPNSKTINEDECDYILFNTNSIAIQPKDLFKSTYIHYGNKTFETPVPMSIVEEAYLIAEQDKTDVVTADEETLEALQEYMNRKKA